MSDKRESQVAAIRRLVKRVTGKKGNVAGRRGPLGRTARILTKTNMKGPGGGRSFNPSRVKDAKRRSKIGKRAAKGRKR